MSIDPSSACSEWGANKFPGRSIALVRHLVNSSKTDNAGSLKLRPDKKIVYLRNWEGEKTRLAGVAQLLRALVKIARSEKPDADVAPPPTPSLVKPQVARRA